MAVAGLCSGGGVRNSVAESSLPRQQRVYASVQLTQLQNFERLQGLNLKIRAARNFDFNLQCNNSDNRTSLQVLLKK